MLGVILALSVSVFLDNCLRERKTHAKRLRQVIQEWEEECLPTTTAWRVQEHLSSLQWLGPLRPEPPRNAVKECVVPAVGNWLVLVLRTARTRQQLNCLEDLKGAKEAHLNFKIKMISLVVFIFSLIANACTTFFSRSVGSSKTNIWNATSDNTDLADRGRHGRTCIEIQSSRD